MFSITGKEGNTIRTIKADNRVIGQVKGCMYQHGAMVGYASTPKNAIQALINWDKSPTIKEITCKN